MRWASDTGMEIGLHPFLTWDESQIIATLLDGWEEVLGFYDGYSLLPCYFVHSPSQALLQGKDLWPSTPIKTTLIILLFIHNYFNTPPLAESTEDKTCKKIYYIFHYILYQFLQEIPFGWWCQDTEKADEELIASHLRSFHKCVSTCNKSHFLQNDWNDLLVGTDHCLLWTAPSEGFVPVPPTLVWHLPWKQLNPPNHTHLWTAYFLGSWS